MRERVRWILVTHHHIDHSAGVSRLKRETGAEIVAFGPPKSAATSGQAADWAPDRKARDGEVIEGTEWGLEVLHTPGHASDHLCFFLEEERVLFTGDTVLSGSTTVINPPDGDMAAYLQSLERLRKRRLARLCPGHGDVLEEPKAILAEYVAHRIERENQILEALAAGASKITDLVAKIYVDTPQELHDMAGRSVLAHLQKLKAEGRVSGRDANSAWKVA
jgi:glyoxylase-like metal-dependent hydrolase (beta-lactamase superfamily II)